jgi:hypothetical protein
MPQKHYAPTKIAHPTNATAPEPNAIALPDHWVQPDFNFGDAVTDNEESGVADLGYERLNRPVIETSIDKAWGFSTYFFHTLIKQRQFWQAIYFGR